MDSANGHAAAGPLLRNGVTLDDTSREAHDTDKGDSASRLRRTGEVVVKVRAAISAGLLAAATVGFSAMSQSEAGAAVAGQGTGAVNVAGVNHVVSKALADKINSGDLSGLSASQLAQAGIHPGIAAPDGTRPTLVPKSNGGIQPRNAIGCNATVCIYVFGSGTLVTDWDSSWNDSGSNCTYGVYWYARMILTTTNTQCGSNVTFWTYWQPNERLPGQVCNSFIGSSHKPCEWVSS